MVIAWVPAEINYYKSVPLINLSKALLIGYLAYGVSFYYCSISEEYKANRLRRNIAIAAVATFFFAIMIMNPPELVKDFAAALGGTPAVAGSDEITSGAVVPSTLDKGCLSTSLWQPPDVY